jgi:hypothetical protein
LLLRTASTEATDDAGGYHQALNLAGALVDLGDLGVAVETFHRILSNVPVTPEDLNGVLGSRLATSEAMSLAIEDSAVCRCPAALSAAARRVRRRAASISTAMSASMNEIAWWALIGLPKVLRSFA